MIKTENPVQFCITPSQKYGYILIAFTAVGVCSIAIGKSKEIILDDTKNRFTHNYSFSEVAFLPSEFCQIISYIENPTDAVPSVGLDEKGTAFQKSVWQALRKIPFGNTISYSDLAENIGNKKAFRAVAKACACNPIAVVTPCHRVIKKDGSISGYYWGKEIKRQLLKDEGVVPSC
ncbi:MAG: methylated-DNA--[protein]-cysteine S-methyltransferase [Chlamydia sp.]